jgi:hypothetical protein
VFQGIVKVVAPVTVIAKGISQICGIPVVALWNRPENTTTSPVDRLWLVVVVTTPAAAFVIPEIASTGPYCRERPALNVLIPPVATESAAIIQGDPADSMYSIEAVP